jgi:hypothetical protein
MLTLYFRDQELKLEIPEGKFLVNPTFPDSEIPDESVVVRDESCPAGIIVSSQGRVMISFPKPVGGGEITRFVKIVRREQTFYVSPREGGREVPWNISWREIKCNSKGHAEYVIEKLLEKRFDLVAQDSKLLFV